MKFLVEIDIENKILPLGYRMKFVSLIKAALKKESLEEYEKLYFYEGKKNKGLKPFVFATYLNKFKFEENNIQVDGGVNLTISTPNYNLGILIYNGLLKLKQHDNLIIKKISLEREKEVKENKEIFKTLSPIYIKDKNNNPLSPLDENFNIELNYISNFILKSYRGYGLERELNFRAVDMKKNVIKESIKGFKEKTNKEFMFITAYSGVFELEGSKEDLNLLKQLGVGYRRNEGFGFIDLI